jgi:amidase
MIAPTANAEIGQGRQSRPPKLFARRSVLRIGASAAAVAAAVKAPPASAKNGQFAGSDIVMLDATALSDAIRTRQVSCVEVMNAYLDQIARLNAKVNAIVALQQAEEKDRQLARGDYEGWLHGFPQAIKDLETTRGVVTTFGSPIFLLFVPQSDSIVVERMRRAGAIIIGKTNVPEFGLGSQSYNPVYGTTLNAYDQSRTSGGSSGGASVAVALRMMAVADGSDYMGSLRNPTAFNNVFGFRTSYGRVPSLGPNAFLPSMGVVGPIARTVPDLAMLLAIQAGYDPRVPLSIRQDPLQFAGPLQRDFRGVRIAWGGDFKGYLTFEPGILDLCEEALKALELIGCTVEPAVPDYPMDRLWRDFVTLRSWQVGPGLADLYDDPPRRALLKPEVIWEIENGLKLTAREISAASAGRSAWYQAFRQFLDRYEYFVVPSAQVFPFDAQTHCPAEINGRRMDTYHRWMEADHHVGLPGPERAGRLQCAGPADGHADRGAQPSRARLPATCCGLRSGDRLDEPAQSAAAAGLLSGFVWKSYSSQASLGEGKETDRDSL